MPWPVIQKNYKMRYASLLFILLSLSCADKSRLVGFNTSAWQDDPMGCSAARLNLIDELMERKAELTELGQEDIVALLGKPDMHELYSRNKKSFCYFLASGPECEEASSNPPKLIIRFDGLGRSKDIIYYKQQD